MLTTYAGSASGLVRSAQSATAAEASMALPRAELSGPHQLITTLVELAQPVGRVG
jgi:hypothetical protein